MTVYLTDPTTDPRWPELLQRHPDASVFHMPAWLMALRDTYGYSALALTEAAPGEPMRNGLVFSHVKSWMTGSRIVSLPFSDHCQPLVDSPGNFAALWSRLEARADLCDCRYVELRPLHPVSTTETEQLRESAAFQFHMLDLQPDEGELYRKFHKSCIQRKLDRAEREGVRIVHGQSEELLDQFYRLLLLTRRRHSLPPQPRIWFQNLVRHFGTDLEFWVAWQGDRALAAILTLASPRTVVYKYGASDAQFHHVGAMPALFWRAILYAKSRNAAVFDMGRSDSDNPGLIQFKDRWGAKQMNLVYFRSTPKAVSARPQREASLAFRSAREGLTKQVLANLPDFCLTTAGRLLYRHMG
jgi:CelD/BcsL family acetyltransferase involved in cellulose biosynthesis